MLHVHVDNVKQTVIYTGRPLIVQEPFCTRLVSILVFLVVKCFYVIQLLTGL